MPGRLIFFFGFNLWMFSGLYLSLSRRQYPVLDALVGAFLLQCTQILATEMLAAAVGMLRLETVLIMNSLIAIATWAYSISRIKEQMRKTIGQIRAFIIELKGWGWVGCIFLALIWVYILWISIHKPASGWDTNMYHMPIAALRMQAGDLQRLKGGWTYIEGYPETGEMLMVWPILFLHSQTLVDAVQWPFWVFGTLALVSLSIRLGAGVTDAVMASLAWALAPVTILQAQEGYVDLIVAGLFWMGMCFALRPPSISSMVLVGISAGMLLGTKFGTFHLIVGIIGVALWFAFQARTRFQTLVLALCLSGLLSGLINSYWYLDNYRHTGNPLWPLGLSIGPLHFQGPFALSGYSQWYTPEELRNQPVLKQWWTVWKEEDSYYTWDSKLNGFGPIWFIIGLPSILMWVIMERKQRFLLLILVALLLAQPLSWHTRYILFFLGLAVLAISWLLKMINRIIKNAIQILIICGAIFSFAVSFDIYSFKFIWIPEKYKTASYGDWALSGGNYRFLDANSWTSDTVAYAGAIAFPGLLWGEDLRHHIVYLDLRMMSSNTEWLESLRRENIRWFFVIMDSPEDRVLQSIGEFRLLVEDQRFEYPNSLRTRLYIRTFGILRDP